MIGAIVPACGLSRRMGRPKLVLPVEGRPLIARVVSALREGGADRVLVVAAPASVEGAEDLAREAEAVGAEVVRPPEPTPDMRATVEFGVAHLRGARPPGILLLCPADSVGLDPAAVRTVITQALENAGRIAVASYRGTRGHPVALPWEVALRIESLPAGVGVNQLVASEPGGVLKVECEGPGILADLDTPEDYRRWSSDA